MPRAENLRIIKLAKPAAPPQGQTFIFTPQSFDRSVNYMDTDPSLAMSTLAYSLNYLATNWRELGRPTVTLILR